MTNFEKWVQTATPESLAELYSAQTALCPACPAYGACNDLDEPSCYTSFLEWANAPASPSIVTLLANEIAAESARQEME